MALQTEDVPTKSIVRVALTGNPNTGKTSLFNALTGARQHVANYPGVTVEKREGQYVHEGRRHQVTDLPGTYSLSACSPEERIAEKELLHGEHDVTVFVADATTLGRSLVLLVQVLQLDANPVLALNMADEARQAGQRLDLRQMRALLGIPVIETVGSTGEGVSELKQAISEAAARPLQANRLVLGERLDHALATVSRALAPVWPDGTRGRTWTAQRLLLDDPATVEAVRSRGPEGEQAVAMAARHRYLIEAQTGSDLAQYVTERAFGFVDGLLREVVRRAGRKDARAVSDRIDRGLAHRVLGLPFFLLAMYAVFWVTFTVGEIPMGWIEQGFAWLGEWVSASWPGEGDSWVRSLLVDGVIAGVGGVLTFLPNILLLYLGLAVLEDSGYMSRAAFLVDRFMHRFGLHGKSFLPLVTGFGCSIPGILGTRILESERDRLATMLVLPLMSCGARLPIWMLLIPAFFAPSWRAPMLWLIYVIGIVLALVLALLLRRTLLRGEESPFVMELPPYRMPTGRGLLTKAYERSRLYVHKAGTVILAMSVVMWAAPSFPKPPAAPEGHAAATTAPDPTAATTAPDPTGTVREEAARALQHSVAGTAGRAIAPLLEPLGFDWRLATALIGAFAAKEVFVSQLGIVYSLGETAEESVPQRERLRQDYSPLAGFSLMVFLLVATPCMATVAVTRRESGRWRWALLQFGALTALAWVLSFLIYQIGVRLG